MYNPWSRKTIWISQITTGSSSKRGSSFKVLIYPGPAVLRIGNVWKTRQLFVKIKFSLDTDIGRNEWHARGGGQWNNERLLGLTSLHEKFVHVLKKQALVGTARKALHLYQGLGNQLRPNPLLTQSILKISESVTRSKSYWPVFEQEGGACKKFWTLLTPPNSCQFEILRPDLFFSLSLSLSLVDSLSLFHPICCFLMCSLSLSLSQLEIYFLFINFIFD